MTDSPSETPHERLDWETYVSSLRLTPAGQRDAPDVAERRERTESLRLTQLALGVEVYAFHLPQLAHWVHTGQELSDDAVVDVPDAARWKPGDDAG